MCMCIWWNSNSRYWLYVKLRHQRNGGIKRGVLLCGSWARRKVRVEGVGRDGGAEKHRASTFESQFGSTQIDRVKIQLALAVSRMILVAIQYTLLYYTVPYSTAHCLHTPANRTNVLVRISSLRCIHCLFCICVGETGATWRTCHILIFSFCHGTINSLSFWHKEFRKIQVNSHAFFIFQIFIQ